MYEHGRTQLLVLQQLKILPSFCTTILSLLSSTFCHTVILCVVCGFTVAHAALTNGFYNWEANVYEIKLKSYVRIMGLLYLYIS
jgi:hypothetical protein